MDEYCESIYIAVGVSFLLAIGTLVLLQPKFEAEAYTRLTGKHVGYWDAVWLDLRIQEQVK